MFKQVDDCLVEQLDDHIDHVEELLRESERARAEAVNLASSRLLEIRNTRLENSKLADELEAKDEQLATVTEELGSTKSMLLSCRSENDSIKCQFVIIKKQMSIMKKRLRMFVPLADAFQDVVEKMTGRASICGRDCMLCLSSVFELMISGIPLELKVCGSCGFSHRVCSACMESWSQASNKRCMSTACEALL